MRYQISSLVSSQRLRRVREAHGPAKHSRAKVSFAAFIDALVLHSLSSQGSLGAHLRMVRVRGTSICDSAAQQRRASLSWTWFEALFTHLLRPLAKPGSHPKCFYHHMRLLAVDGSAWSLSNTPRSPRVWPRPPIKKGSPERSPSS